MPKKVSEPLVQQATEILGHLQLIRIGVEFFDCYTPVRRFYIKTPGSNKVSYEDKRTSPPSNFRTISRYM